MDLEETIEVQEERIEKFNRGGGRQFTKDGRSCEITIDCDLQGRNINFTNAKTVVDVATDRDTRYL